MLQVIVHAADIQDRDGGALLLASLFGLLPFLRKLYADAGYSKPQTSWDKDSHSGGRSLRHPER